MEKQQVIRVHFEDEGQDFLQWDIKDLGEGLGVVVGCSPFQGSVWIDQYILNVDELREGVWVKYSKGPTYPVYTIKYRIEKVEQVEIELAA